MEWFLYLIGCLWIVAGGVLVLYTQMAMEFLKGFLEGFEGTRLKVFGLLPFSIGIMLIISAWWSKAFWGILILGLLLVVKGIVFLFAPVVQVEKMIQYWYEKVGEVGYRFWGLVVVILGIYVLSSA